MGSAYSILAKRFNDKAWEYSWNGEYLIMFIVKSIYALCKYSMVNLSVRRFQKEGETND